MLTADLVNARRKGGELHLVKTDLARAEAIAAAVLETAQAFVGAPREDLEEALASLDVPARDVRLRAGLVKLVEDRCTFDGAPPEEATALRSEVFTRAAAARRACDPTQRFDREALLAEIAGARGVSPEALERALFSDLRGAQVLCEIAPVTARALAEGYDRAQAQAILLRAVRVRIDLRATPGAARAFFRRLKFLRLLYTLERTEDGHRVVVDGPFSLFDSVTKYGLQLALLVPALDGCEAWELEGDIRWGKERSPLTFRLRGGAARASDEAPRLPDEVEALRRAFKAQGGGWAVSASSEILDLPGVGLCVPDLAFKRGKSKVFLEVMGFWSRDAVWRRVELAQAGLAQPILFAVSSRLRVSEQVLDGVENAALYVYKGTMSARAIAERLDRLAGATGC